MTEAPRRRGRPRTRPRQVDPGTPELQRHRRAAVGEADPCLAENPLGLMAARGLITPAQAAAGGYYAVLYRRAVGRPYPSCAAHYQRLAVNYVPLPPDSGDEAEAEARRLFRLGKERLLAAGQRAARATEELVVFGTRPAFLVGRRLQDKSGDTLYRAILAGLDALADCYGFTR
jgi:hypothetical protein